MFAERLFRHRGLDLGHESRGLSRGQVGVDPVLDRGEPEGLQPGRLGGARDDVGQPRVGVAPPLRQGGAQRGGRGCRVAGAEVVRPGPGHLFEPSRVELTRVDPEPVAATHGLDRRPRAAGLVAALQGPPQACDVGVDRALRRARRAFAPHRVDQRTYRDDCAGAREEDRQHQPLLASTDRHWSTVALDLQGPEHAERQPRSVGPVGTRLCDDLVDHDRRGEALELDRAWLTEHAPRPVGGHRAHGLGAQDRARLGHSAQASRLDDRGALEIAAVDDGVAHAYPHSQRNSVAGLPVVVGDRALDCRRAAQR